MGPSEVVQSCHALIVEDDLSTRDLLARALDKAGFVTDVASTVGEALMRLDDPERLPTCVLLDLGLPDAAGTILLRRIRRDDLPIKVCLITGRPEHELGDLAKLRPDTFLQKPVDLRKLLKWLRDACGSA